MMDFLFFSAIWLIFGVLFANVNWKHYDSLLFLRGFSLLSFFLWPASTPLNYMGSGLMDKNEVSVAMYSPISIFKSGGHEIAYKALITFIWPFKIAANVFLIGAILFSRLMIIE
jgi:hypothetical protein